MKMIKKLFSVVLSVLAMAVCALPISAKTAKAANVTDVTEQVSVYGWISQNELKVTYLDLGASVQFEEIGYGIIDNDLYTYAQDYIAVNGRTIKEINTDASLGAENWTYTVFPSTLEGTKYKLPIIVFVNNGLIEIKLHNEYVKLLGDCVEITAKAGLWFEYYTNRYEVTADKTFVAWEDVPLTEVDITESVSVSGWNSTGDIGELMYTRVCFETGVLPDEIDYGILDRTDWMYLQEYILFNGKTIKEINDETDVSGYQFATFPSTAADFYKLPIIIFENNNAIELKFHKDYLQTVSGDMEITVKAGLYIAHGNTRYTVSKDVVYTLAGNIWADKNRLFNITYFVNGEQYGEIEQLPYNSPLYLRDDVETEAGFVFSGWEYMPTAGVVQDMEIHGYVRPIRYNITYHLNGGKNNANNPIVYYVTDGEVVLKDATKDGAIFKGWYTSEDYTEKVETLSAERLGNLELYALFEETGEKANGCKATLGVNGGLFAVVGLALLGKKRKEN